MSFLNWMLLGGTAAFTLPLLIHLLNRSRFQLVDWGAMQLLEAALQANSRRVQWQSLLLLLIRCAIPILLAFALARPVLTQWRMPGSGGDKSLVLLIDNSFSMDRASARGTSTCLASALQQAAEIVQRQTTATEFSVWAIGGTSTDVLAGTTFDRRRALTKLQTIRSGAGSVTASAALATGLKQSQQMQNANREIIVISDFQSHDWQAFNDSEQTAWKSRVEAESIRPRLSLIKIEPSSSDSTNISLVMESIESPLIVAGQSFPIVVQVRNHGNASVEDVAVGLQVGGVELTSRRVSIPALGKTQAVFACQIDAPGQYALEIGVEDSQGLSTDNRVYHIVDVREAVRVLLIDSQPSAPLLKRSSGYLSLALSPFQANEATKNYAITHTIAANQIQPQILNEHDVVIMSNIQRLDNSAAESIATFVRGGGGLLLFAGNGLDLNWYNLQWGTASKSPLLPANFTVEKMVNTRVDANSEIDASTKIQNSQFNHPALKEFNRPGAGELSTVEIRRTVALQATPAARPASANPPSASSRAASSPESGQAFLATEASGAQAAASKDPLGEAEPDNDTTRAQVLLRLENGQPLLVAKQFEDGKVLQFATAADDSWSNFPLRPAYVPLMQGLVQWLASGVDVTHNLKAGEPLTLALKGPAQASVAGKPFSGDPLGVTLALPDRELIPMTLAADSPIRFDQTSFPGIYRLTSHGTQAESLFAVNVQAAESEPQTLEPQQLQEFATSMNATLAATAASYIEQESLRNNGRELWRMLMLALVACLFVELWLQQRISRGGA